MEREAEEDLSSMELMLGDLQKRGKGQALMGILGYGARRTFFRFGARPSPTT